MDDHQVEHARAALEIAATAPSAAEGPSLAEMAAGAATVASVLVGTTAALLAHPARPVGIAVAAALLAVHVAWWTRRRAGQVARTTIDHVTQAASLGVMVIPMSLLIQGQDVGAAGAVVASTSTSMALAAFIALRWRR